MSNKRTDSAQVRSEQRANLVPWLAAAAPVALGARGTCDLHSGRSTRRIASQQTIPSCSMYYEVRYMV